MDFIANYWYVWLAVMVVCMIFAIINQLQRIKRVSAGIRSRSMDDPISQMSKGAGSLMVVALLGWGSGVLLVIAVVIHIIRYVNG
jgi:hypothetical protein